MQVPFDVVIARAVHAHTRALVAAAAACLVLTLIGVVALSLAGPDRSAPMVTAGLTLLGVGQLSALGAAAVTGAGLVGLLREVGEPGSQDSAAAARAQVPARTTRRTARRLAILMRIVVGACVLAVTVWVLADIGAAIGAVIGTLVTLQLVVVLALVRVHLLRAI